MRKISRKKVNAAIKKKFEQVPGPVLDGKGKLLSGNFTDNLIDGVKREQFEKDMRDGDGKELEGKFLACHSSSALAVNCFAPFKKGSGHTIPIPDTDGNHAYHVCGFERKFPIPEKPGNSPNLDVVLCRENEDLAFVAIESKFTEYFKPHSRKIIYKPPYQKPKYRELVDEAWHEVYRLSGSDDNPFRHLDVAQLYKHALGLSCFACTHSLDVITLLYLYWEPENADEIEICRLHRNEIDQLKRLVENTKTVKFQSLSYPELWREWSQITELAEHAARLEARYRVGV